MKLWDIKAPRDNWERGYAKLEHARIGLEQTFSTHIEVEEPHVICGEVECICDHQYEEWRESNESV
jgi:hypothetical protein